MKKPRLAGREAGRDQIRTPAEQQGFEDRERPGMPDHDVPAAALAERARKAPDAGDQRRPALPARAGAPEQGAAPRLDRLARDRRPGTALPGAEIELAEARVEDRPPARDTGREGVRERAATAGGARPDRGTGQVRQRGRQGRRDIEAAIADPGDAFRRAVAEQEDDQTPRAGTQDRSARPSSLRCRAATNSRSDSRLT